jgi:hypothetical protein
MDRRGGLFARMRARRSVPAQAASPSPVAQEPPDSPPVPDPQRWLPTDLAGATPVEPVPTTAPAMTASATATLVRPESPWTVDPDRAPAPPPQTEDEPPSDLHRRAAEAYCSELLAPEAVPAAVEVALWSDGSSDAELLSAARTAAAERLAGDAKPHGLREALAVEHESACDLTPSRLAARANGTLAEPDQRELERHLGDCLLCQAAELREDRATRAFEAVLLLDGAGPAPVAAGGAEASANGDRSSRWTPGNAAIAGAAAVSAGLPPTPTPVARRQPRRRRVLLGGAGAILAAAVVAVVLIAGGSTKHKLATTQASAPVSPPQTTTTPAPAHHRHVATHRARHPKAAAHKTTHKTTHKATHKSATAPHAAQPATPIVDTPPHQTTPVVVPQSSTPVVTHTVTPTAPTPTSVTPISQSSLPATSAPQKGVGGSSK